MRQIRFHQAATATDAFFTEGVESVVYIRCMDHKHSSQLNLAESNDGECGECVRQQCWKDILGLLDAVIRDTPETISGPEALKQLVRTLTETGIGTFGVANEIEEALTRADAQRKG